MKTFYRIVWIDVPDLQIILIVSKDIKAIEKIINKFVKNKKILKEIIEDCDETIEKECKWSYCKYEWYRVMLLINWKNDWEHLDTLNHEVTHMVDQEAADRFFKDESEFNAYLHESVFRKLRQALKKL